MFVENMFSNISIKYFWILNTMLEKYYKNFLQINLGLQGDTYYLNSLVPPTLRNAYKSVS